jgi:3-hydroxyisobutyrate dehydrogenase
MSGATTAFIGLGVMGYPMAGHLVKAGHACTVYNRTRTKAETWVKEFGGNTADTPAEAATDADFVFACVGNDDDVRSIAYGDHGAFAGMKKGAVFIDHTTASDFLARELDEAAKVRGLGFVDAPVSGGQAGAENGQLTVMCGGDEDAYKRAEPVIQAYAKAVNRLGLAGSGQLCKMVNQITFVGIVQSLAEALVFAEKAGLDAKRVVDVISKGAAQSWQMDNRAETMIDGKFDFGFAVDWARKDLGICLDTGRRIGAQLPSTALIDQFYAKVQRLGGGRWDTSSLITLLTD